MNKMKKLFLIISIPTITILMTLNAPTIYIFGLITIFIIAFYVADKNTQSNDIILQSKLDNPKNLTEYSMIKKSPLFTHNEQPMVILNEKDQIKLKQGERHRLIGLDNFGVVSEIWQHTDRDNPSDEEDIVRLSDDYGR